MPPAISTLPPEDGNSVTHTASAAEWLAQHAEETFALLVARLEDQARQIGQLTAERDALRVERDALQRRLTDEERSVRIQTSRNYLDATNRMLNSLDSLHRELARAEQQVAAFEQQMIENELWIAECSDLIDALRRLITQLESKTPLGSGWRDMWPSDAPIDATPRLRRTTEQLEPSGRPAALAPTARESRPG